MNHNLNRILSNEKVMNHNLNRILSNEKMPLMTYPLESIRLLPLLSNYYCISEIVKFLCEKLDGLLRELFETLIFKSLCANVLFSVLSVFSSILL